MPSRPGPRREQRFETPPHQIISTPNRSKRKEHATPVRAAILGALYFCQVKGIPVTREEIRDIFNVPVRCVSRITTSKEPRQLQNQEGPNPRGRHRKFTYQDAQAIADLLDHEGFDSRRLTWLQLGFEAEVSNLEDLSSRTIQRRMKDLDFATYVAASKNELSKETMETRIDFSNDYLPKGKRFWRKVLFSDELHFGFGSDGRVRIKRRQGERSRPDCIHEKKKPRSEKEKKILHAFVLVGYNFRFLFFYESKSSNGKMDTQIYTTKILPKILPHLSGKILFEDRDSAHHSHGSIKWKTDHKLEWMLNAPSSPDLSVAESVFSDFKFFYSRRPEYDLGSAHRWITSIWDHRIRQEKINKWVDEYPERLKACINGGGKMTIW
jgi:hypothetical protein